MFGGAVELELNLDSGKFFNQLKTEVQKSTKELEKLNAIAPLELAKKLGVTNVAAQDLKKQLIAVNRSDFRSTVSELRKVEDKVNRLSVGFRSLKKVAEGALLGIGASISTKALDGLLRGIGSIPKAIAGSLDVSRDFETLRVTLGATSKDAAEAQASMAFLFQTAQDLKLPILELAQGYTAFSAASKAAGMSTEEVNVIFSQASQGFRVFGLGAEETKGAFLALTQMMSKGKVSAEELSGQLGERLPGAVALAAESLGLTTAEMLKMQKNGEILSKDFLPRFTALLSKKTDTGLAESLKTANSTMIDFQNKLLQLKLGFGEAISPAFVAILDAISTIFDGLGTGIFDQLNSQALRFKDYIAANPEMLERIGAYLEGKLISLFDTLADVSGKVLDALSDPNKMQKFETFVSYSITLMSALAAAATAVADAMARAASNKLTAGDVAAMTAAGAVAGGIVGGPAGAAIGAGLGLGFGLAKKGSNGRLSENGLRPHRTGTLAAQEYGAGRDGYKHSGQDFDLEDDGAFQSYIGGVITRIGSDPGGYGNYIDIFNSSLGVVERIAEADKVLVKLGDIVQVGQTVAEGTRDTGVIHYEIRTDADSQGRGGFGSQGTVDPVPFLSKNGIAFRSGQTVTPATRRATAGASAPPLSQTLNPDGSARIATNRSSSSSGGSGNSAQANLDKYFDALSYLEANNDPQAFNRDEYGNIYASGAFQFTPITREDAAILGTGDAGDRNASYETQRSRTQAFAKIREPQGYAAAARGDWAEANRQMNSRWVALPGGGEPQSDERMAEFNRRLGPGGGGGGSNDYSILDTPYSPAIDPEKAAEEAARVAEEAAREAERKLQEAQRIAREAQSEAVRVRSAEDTTRYQTEDANVENSRKEKELELSRLGAQYTGNDAIEDLISLAQSRSGAYDKVSDEIVTNNRAMETLRDAISDEEAKTTYGDTPNPEVIAQWKLQIEQLEAANTLLKSNRAEELAILNLKDEQTFKNEQELKLKEQSAILLEDEYNIALAQDQLANSRIYDPEERLRAETASEILGVEASFNPQLKEIEDSSDELYKNKEVLEALVAVYPELQRELDDLNSDLAFNERRWNNVNEQMSIAKGLAGIDLEKFLIDREDEAYNQRSTQRTDFLSNLESRNRQSVQDVAGRDGTIFDVNAVQRRQGTEDINNQYAADIATAQNTMEGGELEATVVALERLRDIDLSNLMEQTKTLGETINDDLNQGFKDVFSSIIDGSKSAGEAILDFITNIASKLLSYGLDALFSGGSGGSGIGSIFTGLFAADGYIPNYDSGNIGSILSAASRESNAMPSGASLVVANSSEAILTRAQQANIAGALSSSGNRGGLNSNVSITVNNQGANLEPKNYRLIENIVNKSLSREMKADGILSRR